MLLNLCVLHIYILKRRFNYLRLPRNVSRRETNWEFEDWKKGLGEIHCTRQSVRLWRREKGLSKFSCIYRCASVLCIKSEISESRAFRDRWLDLISNGEVSICRVRNKVMYV